MQKLGRVYKDYWLKLLTLAEPAPTFPIPPLLRGVRGDQTQNRREARAGLQRLLVRIINPCRTRPYISYPFFKMG
ncbi:MAG: hypothetical protein AUK43_10400 [Oscillatoriales cyanobacterium CG2_30_40_61]|nr:MAG: hypothetical protein AUK43_10400 [Oscillatoriales cyanobacterium CG2_30_40_61]